MTLYPLTFEPIFKERIWGGRKLETLYGKSLPAALSIGESWEISDRPGDESVVASGPLRGRTLRWLMDECPAALLGNRNPMPARFPLLIKIIDSRDTLSLQVHPPAAVAERLGGEPKTEMWYVARAEAGAELFAGLKKGVTRAEFEQKLAEGTVEECFHRLSASEGAALFLPSGRVHALGAGTVIFEVQQNSDTTYRVFDWNRIGTDGKPRQLHIPQSLASIDYEDFEPALLPQTVLAGSPGTLRPLVKNDLFTVNLRHWAGNEKQILPGGQMRILGILAGAMTVEGNGEILELSAGQFCLIPAQCDKTNAQANGQVSFLEIG